MKTSYNKSDVTFLAKDITNRMKELSMDEYKKEINNGIHYRSLLPEELPPTNQQISMYYESMKKSKCIAEYVAILANKLYEGVYKKYGNLTLVSLMRAGTPFGILLKRFFKARYDLDICHYSISIIPDKGFDLNALQTIANKHKQETIQFVDGWTGKGAIFNQVKSSLQEHRDRFPDIRSDLAVLVDPTGLATFFGTTHDTIIGSGCLNAITNGLVSRSILNDMIGPNDYHGLIYYKRFEPYDLSNDFIDDIVKHYHSIIKNSTSEMQSELLIPETLSKCGRDEIKSIIKKFKITESNVRPGLGETTRALLRADTSMILVDSFDDLELKHILNIAKQQEVTIIFYPLCQYKVVALTQ